MILIVLVVLMFFGSKNIPSLAKGLGKAMREFKEASDGIKREIEESAKPVNTTLDQMHDGWNKTVEEVKKESSSILEPDATPSEKK